MDIQLILEFKNSFEKYCLVFPKNPKKGVFFWDTLYIAKSSGPSCRRWVNVSIWSMVLEVIKDRTNQGFPNISSYRRVIIMFDLSKSFSQLCLSIYGEKINNKVRERKKSKINSSKSFPHLLSCKIKQNFFYKDTYTFFKYLTFILCSYFRYLFN